MPQRSPDPQIGLDLEGPRVTVRVLLEATAHFLRMLELVDREVLKRTRSSLDWVVTGMSAGSARLTARPSPIIRNVPIWAGPTVVKAVEAGFETIRVHRRRPKYFSELAMREVVALTSVVEKEGITAVAIRANGNRHQVSKAVAVAAAEELGAKEEAVGSVEGRLETVTVHGQDYFNVYDELTGRAVRCYFRPDQLETVRMAFTRRVLVYGAMYLSPAGERESMRVTDIYLFPEDHELPPVDAYIGALKDG